MEASFEAGGWEIISEECIKPVKMMLKECKRQIYNSVYICIFK